MSLVGFLIFSNIQDALCGSGPDDTSQKMEIAGFDLVGKKPFFTK